MKHVHAGLPRLLIQSLEYVSVSSMDTITRVATQLPPLAQVAHRRPRPGPSLKLARAIAVEAVPYGPRTFAQRGKLNAFEFLWPIHGTVEIPGQQTVSPQQLALLTPGEYSFHGTGAGRAKALCIQFRIRRYPESWGDPAGWPGRIDLPQADICRPLLCHLLTHAAHADHLLAQPMLAALLTAYITGHTGTDALGLAPMHPVVEKALTFIRGKLDHFPGYEFAAEEIAHAAGVRQSNLCRLFHQHLDSTPMRIVYKARLDRAVDMIRTSGLPLGVIAEMTGFNAEPTLARWCRQELSCTPMQVRQRFRNHKAPFPLPRSPQLAAPAISGELQPFEIPDLSDVLPDI